MEGWQVDERHVVDWEQVKQVDCRIHKRELTSLVYSDMDTYTGVGWHGMVVLGKIRGMLWYAMVGYGILFEPNQEATLTAALMAMMSWW